MWRAQVYAAERAFAKTMADRDHAAFARFVSDEALFFGVRQGVPRPRRGGGRLEGVLRQARGSVFVGAEQVEVLAGGQLALSSGPVRDPAGTLVSRFNSIWRQEAPGVWRVVFDKGEPLPAPPAASQGSRLAAGRWWRGPG